MVNSVDSSVQWIASMLNVSCSWGDRALQECNLSTQSWPCIAVSIALEPISLKIGSGLLLGRKSHFCSRKREMAKIFAHKWRINDFDRRRGVTGGCFFWVMHTSA